ncbi:MAG: 6-carboxytetrahydropterin synthase [Thermoanaerobaculia bacterium]
MERFELEVNARFEAAHHLRSYQGAPEPVHGHTWKVAVRLLARHLDGEGIGVDFLPLRRALGELASGFDHRDINTVPPFDVENPTTENLAVWFHGRLAERFPQAEILAVTVWEGPHASATYYPETPTESAR